MRVPRARTVARLAAAVLLPAVAAVLVATHPASADLAPQLTLKATIAEGGAYGPGHTVFVGDNGGAVDMTAITDSPELTPADAVFYP